MHEEKGLNEYRTTLSKMFQGYECSFNINCVNMTRVTSDLFKLIMLHSHLCVINRQNWK